MPDRTLRSGTPAIASISTRAGDARSAAADIIAQSPDAADGYTVLFCSARHDLDAVGRALAAAGRRRFVAAATSRSIGHDGFLADGITGFVLPSGRFEVADAPIESPSRFGPPDARRLVQALRAELQRRGAGLHHQFGMLLVDAEPRCEERLIATLGMELGDVPVAGGSAGDFYFNPDALPGAATRVLHADRPLRGGAVFSLVACDRPLLALSHHHFTPGRRRLVITAADPARRLVHEIDGRNAVDAYAAACGLRTRPRDAAPFAHYPLMIRVGGQYFARGVQRVLDDGSIEFACAMEPGLVVTVAKPDDMVARLGETFAEITAAIGAPELVIGFECAARTAIMESTGLTAQITGIFTRHRVVGFATLGEQFNTIHANNSFTCVGIGAGG